MDNQPQRKNEFLWIVCGACWLWLLIALPNLTYPGCEILTELGLAATAVLLLPFVCAAVFRIIFGDLRASPVPSSLILVATIVGLTLWTTDWGLILRFRLSEDALERCVRTLDDDAPSCENDSHVGIFHVDRVWGSKDGPAHFIMGYHFKDSYGLAYIPPDSDVPSDYRHLRNNWYFFEGR